MLSRWLRTWDSTILRPLLALLAARGITPATLTITGLAVLILTGIAISQGHTMLAAWLLLLGGLLDALDGELARFTGSETSFGVFLDSIADHCGDLAVYAGLLFYALAHDLPFVPVLILAALFGSLFGSHVRAKAGVLGLDVGDIGWFTRCERVIVLVIGLFGNIIAPALVVLAIFNNVSALQRIAHVMQAKSALPDQEQKKDRAS